MVKQRTSTRGSDSDPPARTQRASKYGQLLQERRVARIPERTLHLRKILDPDEGLVAFSFSGSGTFAIKHLLDGKAPETHPVKAHWMSSERLSRVLENMPVPDWVVPQAWYHFRGITVEGELADFEKHYERLCDQIRDLGDSGPTKIHFDITEHVHTMSPGEESTLVRLWPQLT